MHDLKDVTNNVHYENYRFKKLAYVGGDKTKPTNKYDDYLKKKSFFIIHCDRLYVVNFV